jgi:hypothetical protein
VARAIETGLRVASVPCRNNLDRFFARLSGLRDLAEVRFLVLSIRAAALILARWIAENPPKVVLQSRLGFALQKGQTKPIGLVGSTSGIEGRDFVMLIE